MNKSVRKNRIETIFVLMVFCVFAASVLTVLMLGGSVYSNTAALSGEGYDERTCLSYIWSKVKNSDAAGNVFLDEIEGVTMLAILEEVNGRMFRTLIYYYDGWLYELFSRAALFPGIESGQRIIKTEPLVFEDAGDGLIKATVDGRSLLIYPRQ
ncbi:MAG: DUF4860 domain-containing protein [Defluviitaleaceae bacterium]|nr:DUF4860 domain-containing protein [Defluviitaleaceae bacterium]MCL2837195.1 DUF4860 domain-containing protein [Defluviitaleaceae bacterium]